MTGNQKQRKTWRFLQYKEMGFLNSSFQVERKRNNHYYLVNSSSWHTFKYILQNRLCYFLLRKCFIPLSTFSRIYFNETFTRPASCFYCMHLVSTRCHCRACLHISEMQEEKLDFSTDSLMQGFGELYGNEFDHLTSRLSASSKLTFLDAL